MKRLLVVAVLLFTSLTFNTRAQSPSCPEPLIGLCFIAPPTGYSFGQAKEHSHGSLTQASGYYCGRGLVTDSTNNPKNVLLGNTICINSWPSGPQWFWYDWGTDDDAISKISAWSAHYPYQWVAADYDPVCGLSFDAHDPWQ